MRERLKIIIPDFVTAPKMENRILEYNVFDLANYCILVGAVLIILSVVW